MYPLYFEYENPILRSHNSFDRPCMGMSPKDFFTILAGVQTNSDNVRVTRDRRSTDTGSSTKEDKDKFQVNLDIKQFSPEDIVVKTLDGYLIVEAKHEEREDDRGFVARSFTRRYLLPEYVDVDSVFSKLSSDGLLSITAPLKVPPNKANERIVPIIHTGPMKKRAEGSEEHSQ